jgi:hypothetical protein
MPKALPELFDEESLDVFAVRAEGFPDRTDQRNHQPAQPDVPRI